jgi:tRNA dimethylallyltransferase
MENMRPLVAIVGPTATGKTDAAIELAKQIDGEIISADSMLIYKGMDIGTAKPSPAEMQGIPHHMIDVAGIDEPYSVARYRDGAKACIEDILGRNKIPVVVGGTGLYVNALTMPMVLGATQGDDTYREQLRSIAKEQGLDKLYEMLESSDPVSALRIHPHDERRIIRALEIFHLTGRRMSQMKMEDVDKKSGYDLIIMGITLERTILYDRINRRVDAMMDKGLVDEVRSILEKGYDPGLQSLQGLGYKETIAFLNGDATLEETIETIKRSTRRYAKRQLTWFRRDARITWYEAMQYSTSSELAKIMAVQVGIELQKHSF